MAANRTAPHGQADVETLPLFLVAFMRNAKYQEIFKLNNLNHIIIKVEPYRARATTSKGLAMSGAELATCTGKAPKRLIQNVRSVTAVAP
jgi:hypothetical protein